MDRRSLEDYFRSRFLKRAEPKLQAVAPLYLRQHSYPYIAEMNFLLGTTCMNAERAAMEPANFTKELRASHEAMSVALEKWNVCSEQAQLARAEADTAINDFLLAVSREKRVRRERYHEALTQGTTLETLEQMGVEIRELERFEAMVRRTGRTMIGGEGDSELE